jgi:hypothetical protein
MVGDGGVAIQLPFTGINSICARYEARMLPADVTDGHPGTAAPRHHGTIVCH